MRLGLLVAVFVVMVTVLDLAGSFAFSGIPNSETATFQMLAAVAGLDRPGVDLVSPSLRLLARAAGVGAVASLVAIVVVVKMRPPTAPRA